MAMKMLDAGGMPLVTDGLRGADASNPNGYYEFEPVKDLERGQYVERRDLRKDQHADAQGRGGRGWR